MRAEWVQLALCSLFSLACNQTQHESSPAVSNASAAPLSNSGSAAPSNDATRNQSVALPGAPAVNAVPAQEPQLSAETREICRKAHEHQRPVLVEFSADWCHDCQVLAQLKSEPKLKAELEHFEQIKIDVDDDRYEDLKLAFDVRSIARWVLLMPGDCTTPLFDWNKIADRVLEPTQDEVIDSETLSSWLNRHRKTG